MLVKKEKLIKIFFKDQNLQYLSLKIINENMKEKNHCLLMAKVN